MLGALAGHLTYSLLLAIIVTMVWGRDMAEDQKVINIQLPRVMSPLAKRKLHELLDAIVDVRGSSLVAGEETIGGEDGLRRFIADLEQKPKRKAYLNALVKAGAAGLKLAELRKATGERKSALGGIASGLTKSWRKYGLSGIEVVERSYEQHRLTAEALRLLKGRDF